MNQERPPEMFRQTDKEDEISLDEASSLMVSLDLIIIGIIAIIIGATVVVVKLTT